MSVADNGFANAPSFKSWNSQDMIKNYGILIVIITTCLFVTTVRSQTWSNANIITDGDIHELAVNGSGVVVGAVWVFPGEARIVRSSNDGTTWQQPVDEINRGFTGAVFTNATTAFVSGGTNALGLVYKSTNSGASWDVVYEGPSGAPSLWCITQSPDGSIFAAGGKGVILKSTDNGASWLSPGSTGITTEIVDIHFVTPDTGFIMSSIQLMDWQYGGALYRTIDGGKTWTFIQPFTAAQSISMRDSRNGVIVGRSVKASVWRTTDGGTTWNQTYSYDKVGYQFEDVARDPNNPYALVAVGQSLNQGFTTGIAIRSTDDGATWTLDSDQIAGGLRTVVMPSSTKTIAAGWGGVVVTKNHAAAPKPTASLEVVGLLSDSFEGVTVGSARNVEFNVVSGSAMSVRLDRVRIVGDTTQWKITEFDELPFDVSEDQGFRMDIAYEPTKVGLDTVTLECFANGKSTPLLRRLVIGEAIAAIEPGITSPSSSVNLGVIRVDETARDTVFVTAKNEAGVSIASVSLEESGGSTAFTVLVSESLPVFLDLYDTLAIEVVWQPKAHGDAIGELVVRSEDSSVPALRIPIDGTALSIVSVDDNQSLHRPMRLTDADGIITLTIQENEVGYQSIVRVFDVTGRLVYQEQLTSAVSRFSTNEWNAGMYFFTVEIGRDRKIEVVPLVVHH